MRRLGLVLGCGLLVTGCAVGLGEHASSPKAVGRETTRAFLIQGQSEAQGYGLYSYLLLGSPPGPDSRERYLGVIAAYLEIPETAPVERSLPRWQLNLTYLPVTEALPAELSSATADPSAAAEWVLRHYDYGRARVILHGIPGAPRNGPYIVSQLKPLAGGEAVNGPFLFQDLSHVQPEMAAAWMNRFMAQASKERYWEADSLPQFALEMRNALAVASVAVPNIQSALQTWIKTP